jgi:hypothetical protein
MMGDGRGEAAYDAVRKMHGRAKYVQSYRRTEK